MPAVPHNPNPALRTVDPLLMSATASSAESYSLEVPRDWFGASLGSWRRSAVHERKDRTCCGRGFDRHEGAKVN